MDASYQFIRIIRILGKFISPFYTDWVYTELKSPAYDCAVFFP